MQGAGHLWPGGGASTWGALGNPGNAATGSRRCYLALWRETKCPRHDPGPFVKALLDGPHALGA